MQKYPLDPHVAFTAHASPGGFCFASDRGKWVFDLPMDNFQEDMWKLIDAARTRKVGYVMIGNWRIVELNNGNNIACVWATSSDKDAVLQPLLQLRDIGFTQRMRFKTDEATDRGIKLGVGLHEYIWESNSGDELMDSR